MYSLYFPECLNCSFKKLILIGGYYNIVMVFTIHRHESAMGAHVLPTILNPLPPSSRSHPCVWSQSTGFECPASCIELALVIYFVYGNIHVSISLKSPHPHLLPEPKVCSLYLCLFWCLACNIVATVFLNSIYIINTLFLFLRVSLFLTSCCIIGSFHPPH